MICTTIWYSGLVYREVCHSMIRQLIIDLTDSWCIDLEHDNASIFLLLVDLMFQLP